MPQDYDLQIDGSHFNLHWDKPHPPTKQDVEGIVTQYRTKQKSLAVTPPAPGQGVAVRGQTPEQSAAQVKAMQTKPGDALAREYGLDPATVRRKGAGNVKIPSDEEKQSAHQDRNSKQMQASRDAIGKQLQELQRQGAESIIARGPKTPEQHAIAAQYHGLQAQYKSIPRQPQKNLTSNLNATAALPEGVQKILAGRHDAAAGFVKGVLGLADVNNLMLSAVGGALLGKAALPAFGASVISDAASKIKEGHTAEGIAQALPAAFLMGHASAHEAVNALKPEMKGHVAIDVNDPGLGARAIRPTVRKMAGETPVKKPTIRRYATITPVEAPVTRPAPEHGETPVEKPATPPVKAQEAQHPLEGHVQALIKSSGDKFIKVADLYKASGSKLTKSEFAKQVKELAANSNGRYIITPGESGAKGVFPGRVHGIEEQGGKGNAVPEERNNVAATSVRQVPALLKAVTWIKGTRNLDIGGGRFDEGSNYLASEHGVENHILDPFNRSAEHNADVLAKMKASPADTATLANVLNVIEDHSIRQHVLKTAETNVKKGGNVYIGVYEGSKSGVGSKTSKGTWQENRKLATYLPEVQKVFPDAKIEGSKIVATKGGKGNAVQEQGAAGEVLRPESKGASGNVELQRVEQGHKAEEPAASQTEVKQPLTGTKSAVVEAEREQRGLSAVDRQGYAAMGQAYHDGKAVVESGSVNPRALAASVAEKPRPLKANEVGALGFDRARLIHEHTDTTAKLSDAIDKGDETNIALLKLQQAQVESDIDLNDQALVKGGTEQSAAFNARKMMINDDFSLGAIVQRMKVKKGSALTEQQHAKLTQLSEKYEASERKVREQSDRIDKLEADQAVRKMNLQSRRESRAMTRAELDTELDDLMKEFVKTGSKPSAGIDPKLVSTVGKIAYNRLRAGTNTIEGLVDEVHNLLKDHIDGITTRDVRDAISGYGRQPRQTSNQARKQMQELQKQARLLSAIEDAEAKQQPAQGRKPGPASEKVKKLRAQLDEAMKASGLKPQRRNDPLPAIKARLKKQIADLDRRLKDNDFDFPKRKPTAYDEEANKLREERDRRKLEIERAIESAKKPSWQDYLVKWQRAAILSGMTTLGKLSAAVSMRSVTTPMQEVTGYAIGKVMPTLASQSPREGGLSVRAEVAAARQFIERATAKDMWQKLRTGANSLDVLYGRKDILPSKGALAFFGNLHGALKTPAQRAEFFRSYEKRAAFEARAGKDITDPQIQAAISASAYLDSKRAILQNDNLAVSIYNDFLGAAERRAKPVATVARMALPIVRVPTNFVIEVGEHVAGGPIGLAKIIRAKGVENLSPEQSDTVMRLFKKQGVGAGLMALGYFGGNSIKAGGVYVPGKKPKSGEPAPDTMQIFGVDIPSWAQHSAAVAALQLGATARMAVDETQGSNLAKTEEAASNASRGLANEVPFVEELERLGDFMKGGATAGKFAGDVLKGFAVPQLVQQAAKALDPEKQRSPRGLTDTIKEGIPGLREQVPASKQTSRGGARGPRRASMVGGR